MSQHNSVNRKLVEMAFVTALCSTLIALDINVGLAMLSGIGAICAAILGIRLAPPPPKGYQ